MPTGAHEALLPHVLLLPGAGTSPAYWDRLCHVLSAQGVASTAVDLPCEDDSATLETYAELTAQAAERALRTGPRPVILVAHSFGGFTAGLVPDLVPVQRIVLLGAMIPAPGESGSQWWQNTGQQEAHAAAARAAGLSLPLSFTDLFYNGFSPAQVAQAAAWERDQAGTPFEQPWPRGSWPEVPTSVIGFTDDRLLPPDLLRRVARQRLQASLRLTPGGHMGMVSHPHELAEALLRA